MMCRIASFAFLLIPLLTSSGLSQTAHQPKNTASVPLHFVREFSSAKDLKGVSHPIFNKTLDIIAGPKEPGPPPPSELQAPYAVTADSFHRVFVTDLSQALVHVFDFGKAEHSVIGANRLRSPMGVATDHQGNIYVSDGLLRTVLVYDSNGKFVRYLKKPRGDESYFDAPEGIAVDSATDRVYVCDSPRHMVIAFDKKGHIVSTFGKRGGGSAPGEFKEPTQVVVNHGEIFVLDSGNSRVQIVDQRGRLKREIKLPNLHRRAGLAVDSAGTTYVTDPDLNHVQAFGPNGQLLYFFGETGTAAGQFNGVSGAWVNSGDCLYLVDTANRRVQLFQISTLAGGC
jgi:DNA-binding beta-propeller fold protein YncE